MLVIFPIAHSEIARAKELLAWIAELDSWLNHRYLIVASSQVSNADALELSAMAAAVFSGGSVIKQREVVETGWPMAGNAMFQLAAKWVAENGAGYFLWLEADCTPTRPGWLDELENEYKRVGKSFLGTIFAHPFPHLNGCMIYPHDLSSKHPYMLAATTIPWDCRRPDLTMAHGYNTPLIQRMLADPRTNTPMSFPDAQSLSVIRHECVLFHGVKDSSLIARLRERDKVMPTPKKPTRTPPKLVKNTKLVVVLPFCNKDAGVAVAALEWALELNNGRKHENAIVLSYDTSTKPELVESVRAAAANAFNKVSLTTYEPPKAGQLPQTMAFKHAAEYMGGKLIKKSWLWWEGDMVPLRPGWLDVLQAEYLRCGKPFMGSIVPGKGHCNGTAIYPANANVFIREALTMTWTAWDTAMRHEMLAYCHDASHLMQHVWGVVNGRFHPFGGQPPNFNDSALLNQIGRQAVVFHRNKDLSLVRAIKTHGLPALSPSVIKPKEYASGTEIMIVSYHKDVEWLKYCLASVKKFASGFSGVTVLIPTEDRPLFEWIDDQHPDVLVLDYQPPTNKLLWHVAHQLQKFKADEWCPSAEFICHIDSDCVFTEPVTPAEYFHSGKPILWIETFARTGGPWKAVVEKALGPPIVYDTMRRHPAVHYRGLYADARARVSARHKMDFDEYVLSCPIRSGKATESWQMSEFEVLGNVALTPEWKEKYFFVDLGLVKRPHERLLQMWSIGRIDAEQPLPSIGGKAVPLNVFKSLGLEVA